MTDHDPRIQNADAGLAWKVNGKSNDAGLNFFPALAFRHKVVKIIKHVRNL